jgi:hypothetical protein
LFLGAAVSAQAQGDSDPGLSTIGAMRPASALMIGDETYENQLTHFSVGNAFAKGERDVRLIIPQLEVRVPLLDHGYFDVKLPYQVSLGELANISGLGDLMVAFTYMPYTQQMEYSNWTWQITGGAKFGLGNANQTDATNFDRGLPMAYQSTGGSTDVIIGGAISYKEHLTIAAGYQQPIFRYNFNNYYGSDPVNDLVYSNPDNRVSSNLYRNGDVMMRVEGHAGSDRVGISGGPLAFYHLRNDLTTNRNNFTSEIQNSEGFSLNGVANAYIRWGRQANFKLDVTGSYAIVQRDVAPDGTRREWVFMPRFTYFFGQRDLIFR